MIRHVGEQYVMCYFRTEDESLHLATGSPCLRHWQPVVRPVLRSEVGFKSVRDPFVGRGSDNRFHLLFTNSWSSPLLGYATSTDLLAWEDVRLLPVFKPRYQATSAWAPEFVVDWDTGEYFLYWSSVTEDSYHRVYCCTTRDWSSFSPPRVLMNPGYPAIDANVCRQPNGFLLSFKDERDEFKAVRTATARSLDGAFNGFSPPVTPTDTEGPTVVRRGSRWHMVYDHYREGKLGMSVSDDLRTWVETEIHTPSGGARHPSLVTVTPQEFAKVRALTRGAE